MHAEEGFVTLSNAEYANMLDRDEWLQALEAAGVRDWSGYDLALDIYEAFGKEGSDD